MTTKIYTRSHAPALDYQIGGALYGFDREGGDYSSDRARSLYEALDVSDGDTEYVLGSLPDGRWALVGMDVAGHRFAVEIEKPKSRASQMAELAEACACVSLTTEIEALIRETIRLEEHEENPGEWGVWAVGGDVDEPELMGAGPSRREALEDALATAKGWASAVEVSS